MITLQFVAGEGIGSKAIEIFERGWCSHVDAVLADGTLLGARSDAVGGKPPGVQIRPPAYETWARVQRVDLWCTPAQQTDWLNFLEAQIGKPYDSTAIVAFAVQRDWREIDSWFCSELQAAALESCGWLPGPLANPSNEITPRDLLLIVSPWASSTKYPLSLALSDINAYERAGTLEAAIQSLTTTATNTATANKQQLAIITGLTLLPADVEARKEKFSDYILSLVTGNKKATLDNIVDALNAAFALNIAKDPTPKTEATNIAEAVDKLVNGPNAATAMSNVSDKLKSTELCS